MTALSPTFYNIDAMEMNGVKQADLVKAVYNLYKAVYSVCYNLDDDSGTLGTDYLSTIGTDLATAMAALKAPSGPYT
jgi:hypothetical protein